MIPAKSTLKRTLIRLYNHHVASYRTSCLMNRKTRWRWLLGVTYLRKKKLPRSLSARGIKFKLYLVSRVHLPLRASLLILRIAKSAPRHFQDSSLSFLLSLFSERSFMRKNIFLPNKNADYILVVYRNPICVWKVT